MFINTQCLHESALRPLLYALPADALFNKERRWKIDLR